MQIDFTKLSNAALHTQTVQAARHDRRALVQFLRLLGELDARRAYREAGFSSTWTFLRSLAFSESESATRLVAARVVRRYPWIADDLLASRLHLTAVATIGRRVLETGEEHLFKEARGLTKTELQALFLSPSTTASVPASSVARRARIVRLVGRKTVADKQTAASCVPSGATRADPMIIPSVAPGAAPPCNSSQDAGTSGCAATKAPTTESSPINAVSGPNANLPLFSALEASGQQTPDAQAAREDRAPSQPAARDVADESYRMTLYLDGEAHKNLREAQKLACHQIPSGDLNQVVAMALREFVQKRQQRKHGLRRRDKRADAQKASDQSMAVNAAKTATPQEPIDAVTLAHPATENPVALAMRPQNGDAQGEPKRADRRNGRVSVTDSHPGDAENVKAGGSKRDKGAHNEARSRYIPAAIRRAVFMRDNGCCTYCSTSGQRCTERQMLEYDHIVPFALRGEHSVGNLRLRCRAHNALTAEWIFGDAKERWGTSGVSAR